MPDQDQRVAMSKHPYQPESHHFSLNNLSQIFRGAPHFVFSEKVGLGPLVSEKTKQNTIGESSLDHLVIQNPVSQCTSVRRGKMLLGVSL